MIESGVVPRLIEFLSHFDNPKLQFEAVWCVTNIASGSTEDTSYVLENGAIQPLMKLFDSEHKDVVEQCKKFYCLKKYYKKK